MIFDSCWYYCQHLIESLCFIWDSNSKHLNATKQISFLKVNCEVAISVSYAFWWNFHFVLWGLSKPYHNWVYFIQGYRKEDQNFHLLKILSLTLFTMGCSDSEQKLCSKQRENSMQVSKWHPLKGNRVKIHIVKAVPGMNWFSQTADQTSVISWFTFC